MGLLSKLFGGNRKRGDIKYPYENKPLKFFKHRVGPVVAIGGIVAAYLIMHATKIGRDFSGFVTDKAQEKVVKGWRHVTGYQSPEEREAKDAAKPFETYNLISSDTVNNTLVITALDAQGKPIYFSGAIAGIGDIGQTSEKVGNEDNVDYEEMKGFPESASAHHDYHTDPAVKERANYKDLRGKSDSTVGFINIERKFQPDEDDKKVQVFDGHINERFVINKKMMKPAEVEKVNKLFGLNKWDEPEQAIYLSTMKASKEKPSVLK